jgi:Family of unknown function (DUF6502)
MLPARRKSQRDDPIREATISALKHVIDPLLELMFDAGVTVQEFNHLLRNRAVHAASKRVVRECGRNSKSRVAIVTGLPRSEVSKILESRNSDAKANLGQHPARRVLAAWYENARFLAPTGEPAVLPIFGKKRSFERLVSAHGAGIPVRAMLDELTQIDAVERLANQQVRAKSRVPILTGLTTNAIAAIGERCGDLLQTLTNNVRLPSRPLFEATALICDADSSMVPIVRREIAEQGVSFINGASSLLKRSKKKSRKSPPSSAARCRLGVTVFYFEEDVEMKLKPEKEVKRNRRTNLRRHQRTF